MPDLILMDISLPGIDGVEATRQLKGEPSTAAIPIVALTASVMHADRARFGERGLRRADRQADRRLDIPRAGARLLPRIHGDES